MIQKKWPVSFVIAHRGASQLAPENTIAALKIAKERGARWVECDVQFTQDDVPVILHDTQLDRTTTGHGALSNIYFTDLKKLDAGSWFSEKFKNERVPSLREWLSTASQLSIKLNLEIKCDTEKEATSLSQSIFEHVQRYFSSAPDALLISSSNLFALSHIAQQTKSILLGWITENKMTAQTIEKLLQNGIASVHQPFFILDEKYIAALHKMGLRVLAYTVNDAKTAEQLRAIGVDGIFTDNIGISL